MTSISSLFCRSSDDRALPSFPTRRSSDLRFSIGEDEKEIIDVHAGEVLHIPSNVWHKAEALEDTLDVDGMRSEEHTSELQSRRDLVCRLLREKKNTAHDRAGCS